MSKKRCVTDIEEEREASKGLFARIVEVELVKLEHNNVEREH